MTSQISLLDTPGVIAFGMSWTTDSPDTAAIKSVLRVIRPEFELHEVFQCSTGRQYTLASMVCYYGKHYATFVRTATGTWTYFDDTIVREIGKNWDAVLSKCEAGKWQPQLLVYTPVPGTTKKIANVRAYTPEPMVRQTPPAKHNPDAASQYRSAPLTTPVPFRPPQTAAPSAHVHAVPYSVEVDAGAAIMNTHTPACGGMTPGSAWNPRLQTPATAVFPNTPQHTYHTSHTQHPYSTPAQPAGLSYAQRMGLPPTQPSIHAAQKTYDTRQRPLPATAHTGTPVYAQGNPTFADGKGATGGPYYDNIHHLEQGFKGMRTSSYEYAYANGHERQTASDTTTARVPGMRQQAQYGLGPSPEGHYGAIPEGQYGVIPEGQYGSIDYSAVKGAATPAPHLYEEISARVSRAEQGSSIALIQPTPSVHAPARSREHHLDRVQGLVNEAQKYKGKGQTIQASDQYALAANLLVDMIEDKQIPMGDNRRMIMKTARRYLQLAAQLRSQPQ